MDQDPVLSPFRVSDDAAAKRSDTPDQLRQRSDLQASTHVVDKIRLVGQPIIFKLDIQYCLEIMILEALDNMLRGETT